MWIIYKHMFPNNKVYIGLTKQATCYRWNGGNGYQRCPAMWKAICRYGWDSVISTVIEENIPSLEEANQREKYWIKYYNSYVNWDNSNGYNCTIGGDGVRALDYDKILELWNQGYGVNDISQQLNCHRDGVRKALKSLNISLEERNTRRYESISKALTKFSKEDIMNLWYQGYTYEMIRNELNCSNDTICRALNKYNIPKSEREKHKKH